MTWWVKVDDDWRNVDDLTVDEIIAVEQVAGVPWGYINPLGAAPVAKALLAAFLVRDGGTDDEVAKQVGALTVGKVKNRFRWREDDDLPAEWEDGLPVVDPKATSGDRSTG